MAVSPSPVLVVVAVDPLAVVVVVVVVVVEADLAELSEASSLTPSELEDVEVSAVFVPAASALSFSLSSEAAGAETAAGLSFLISYLTTVLVLCLLLLRSLLSSSSSLLPLKAEINPAINPPSRRRARTSQSHQGHPPKNP